MAATTSPTGSVPIDPRSLKNTSPQPSLTIDSSKMRESGSGVDISLSQQVFPKKDFKKTVNTSFTQLANTPDPSFFDINLATVEDFFTLYLKFFYEIPKEGEVNSHTYLITESSEYVNFNPNQEEIEALLEEISDLRTENLELRQEIVSTVQSVQDFRDTNE